MRAKTKPPMNTDEHGAAATKKNLTAETQRTRRFRPWERALPACPGCPTLCTQDACAPRRPRRKILGSLQRIFCVVLRISQKRSLRFGCHRFEIKQAPEGSR